MRRKKAIAQSKGRRELYEKYEARERNRVKDFIDKFPSGLRRHSQTRSMYLRIWIKKTSLAGRGLKRGGGRGTTEHLGGAYIIGYLRQH
jgi:hypothetical protein